jgi:hypothetical protein
MEIIRKLNIQGESRLHRLDLRVVFKINYIGK